MVNTSTSITTGYAEVNGARLYYEIQGAGAPLVLVHAGIADRHMWDAQMPAFAAHYRVMRYDARGFGYSRQPPGPFSRCGDLYGLLRYLGVEKALFVAASMGGATVLDLALEHPDMVAGMVLVAPSIGGRTPPDIVKRCWAEEDDALARGDHEAAVELNLRLWVDGTFRTPDQVNPGIRALVGEMQRQAFAVWSPEAEEIAIQPPAVTRLGAITAPVLVMVGDLDLPDKMTAADELVAKVARGAKTIVAGGAHMVNMEQPGAFNAAALAFLDRLPRAENRPRPPQPNERYS